MHRPIKVTARLASPLAGDAPALDGLMESMLSLYHAKGESGYKIDRKFPAPKQGEIPIPMRREWLGPMFVARCSAPILAKPSMETAEYIGKKIGVEHAGLMAERERKIVATGNSWTKSYRLPLRLRVVDSVVWFAVGDRRVCLKLLRRCEAIGKKISVGYGRVSSWDVEAIEDDLSWFAPSPVGPVLMTSLPVGPWLPADLIGCRRDFAACCPPYWHPDRYGEVVVPC